MGDFNPFATAVLGGEPSIVSHREYQLDSPGKALQQRFKGTAITPSHLHLLTTYLQGNPGLVYEIVADDDPLVSESIELPGFDDAATGWEDNAGAAAGFADVDARFTLAEYVRNASPMKTSGEIVMTVRGNRVLSGVRILGFRIGAAFALANNANNATSVLVRAVVKLNSSLFYGPSKTVKKSTKGPSTFTSSPPVQAFYFDDLGTFWLDPSTNVPWTMATVNQLLANTANYGWGWGARGQVVQDSFACVGVWMTLYTSAGAVSNYYATSGPPFLGWGRYALASTAALSANTWYWLRVSCPLATQSAFIRVPIVKALSVVDPATAAATGEHRKLQEAKLWSPGGVVYTTAATPTPNPAIVVRTGEMLPFLLERSGPAFENQSQPYGTVDLLPIDSSTVATLHGQEITSAGVVSYGGIRLPILWANPNVRPDQPLIVQVRSGAGSLTGGGTLHATATISPDRYLHGETPTVPFDGGAFASAALQYRLCVRSAASPVKGWRLPRADSHSTDLVTSAGGTTQANVETQTQGSTTDSWFGSGTADDRYDVVGLDLVAAPTAPTITATPRPAETITGEQWDACEPSVLPPLVELTITATALGSNFRGYRIWRRRRGAPPDAWEMIGDLDPTDFVAKGGTYANYEASHVFFVDDDAGWGLAGALGEPGWDYAGQVRHANGLSSFLGETVDIANDVEGTHDSWLVCRGAWHLRCPVRVETSRRMEPDNNVIAYAGAGRDHAVTRVYDRVPIERLSFVWTQLGRLGRHALAAQRLASLSGRTMTLLQARGERDVGTLAWPGHSSDSGATLEAASVLTITGGPAAAGYNLPAEIVFDGSNDYASTADDARLDPGTDVFSFMVCARFNNAADATYLSKRNGAGAGDGYMIWRSAADTLQAVIDGAGGTVTATTSVDASLFDGRPHVAWATWDGTTLSLYVDGLLRGTGTGTPGSISNSVALVAGADNAGGGRWAAAPTRAWGVAVGTAHTDDEVLDGSRYLLGYVGPELPPDWTVLFDVADDRSWDGISTVVYDLFGSTALAATINGSAVTRGLPAPIRDRQRVA